MTVKTESRNDAWDRFTQALDELRWYRKHLGRFHTIKPDGYASWEELFDNEISELWQAGKALCANPSEMVPIEMYHKAQKDKVHAQDVAHDSYMELKALADELTAMLRYDCQGPEGDYGAGMEPGDGYVDYYEMLKIIEKHRALRTEKKCTEKDHVTVHDGDNTCQCGKYTL